MTTYFDLLPRDIFYSLCCYLYIRYIEDLCKITNKFKNACEDDRLWKFKINHEFPYIPSEYRISNLLSMKHKYIQLKSIRGVDLESDHFQTITMYFYRASRLTDHKIANELIERVNELRYKGYAHIILIGAIASQNQFLINKYRGLETQTDESVYGIISGFAEAGIYTPKLSEIDKMLRRKTALRDLDTGNLSSEVITGIVRGGDLEHFETI